MCLLCGARTCNYRTQRETRTLNRKVHTWHSLFFPIPSLQVEQAVTCLVRIAKYGKMAAEQYLEHSPNAICKEMAEAFSEKKDPRF